MNAATTEQSAAAKRKAKANLRRWRADPVAFVREVFGAEPDEWQKTVLKAVATDPRAAMSACKGPGKSCLLAWVIWWFLVCYVDAQVMAVSITLDNLKDNLWKELAFWQAKSPMLQAAFVHSGETITNVERPKTWKCTARSFAKDADPSAQASTLAGLHGQNVMVVLDEAGDIPVGVLAAAEAIFAVKGQNAKLVVAGNPTSNQGTLYAIVSNPRGWHITFITGDPDDPKRSPRIDIEWARGWIEKYGRENPWVMVNILGEFPPGGSMQLIGANVVSQAMQRDVPKLAYRGDARIWGVDPARFGDDEIVLMRRQGVLARQAITWRNLDGTKLGNKIAHLIREETKAGEPPDAIFIDVGGVGSSCVDHLTNILGYAHLVSPVDFGSGAERPELYANKRAEMWIAMKEWLEKQHARLPPDPVLAAELQGPEYDFRVVQRHSVYIIESKADMKKRGVPSPNRADALALTFAAPVEPRSGEARERESGGGVVVVPEVYDPMKGF